MSRGDSLTRQWKLMELLDRQRELVVPEVARELETTARTVYRDLIVLQNLGWPIYQDRRGARSRWRVMEGYRRKLSISLAWPELVALTAGRDLLAGVSGTVFHESAISALEKVRGGLPPELLRRADAVARAMSATGGPARSAQPRLRQATLVLVEAIERQESVRLRYRKPGERSPKERLVDPYHLHVQSSAVYLIGFSRDREELRTFLIDRIQEVVPAGQRFERRPDFRAGDLLQGAFGPWSGRPLEIRLRFAEEAAPFVAERKMHPTQEVQWQADGSLDVTLHAPLAPSLVSWLVGFGARVEVLAPKALRERVAAEHREAVGLAPEPR